MVLMIIENWILAYKWYIKTFIKGQLVLYISKIIKSEQQVNKSKIKLFYINEKLYFRLGDNVLDRSAGRFKI